MNFNYDEDGCIQVDCHQAEDNTLSQAGLRRWQRDDWYGISLTEVWRQSGAVPGREPARWAEVASTMFAGIVDYQARTGPDPWRPGPDVPAETIEARTSGVLGEWHGEGVGPAGWCYGDITTTFPPIALAYALYLDGLAEDDAWAALNDTSRN